MKDSILQHDTVALNAAKDALHIIDQTKLPGELVFLDLHTQAEIWNAIKILQVRGAPAIGVAAGLFPLHGLSRHLSGPGPFAHSARSGWVHLLQKQSLGKKNAGA